MYLNINFSKKSDTQDCNDGYYHKNGDSKYFSSSLFTDLISLFNLFDSMSCILFGFKYLIRDYI
jgi:hypothetical protein